ncbi:hypothetical protein CPB84DRAFT_1811634 [Gymnopilus junonius]|uniref:Virilizer N-terminal domain-containing protein n=1 Tax=Gymnopilus junonius TaxID=109634 RepID=A0A9P5TVC4_GYMJU|nr:hypothetical protein CPB84DRAFT_1811634 [Gymnopilus junonius]
MRLLGWYQLEARQNTAAILFPAPCNSLTAPDAFFLDVYFNTISVQPTAAVQDSQDKRAPKNVLASTRIAYAGDQTEFVVDMGIEYATRLVIFNGEFTSMFVAIYGETVTSEHSEAVSYEPKLLPVSTPLPLPPSLDPGNSSNPILLAEQLLQLLPVAPELSFAARLIFVLKPERDDWDLPDFPFFSELDPLDGAYYVAKLLSKAAAQQTRFSRTLLVSTYRSSGSFNEHTLDEGTVLYLHAAAADVEIARCFREDESFLSSLDDLQGSPKIESRLRKKLKQLLARIRGWQSFEDVLTNTNDDFVGSASFLKDIVTEENAVGCWLKCMLTHDNLTSRLVDVPTPSDTLALPPLLFHDSYVEVSHKTFLVFVKALLAVSGVLTTLAWAGSVGDDQCRERALALLVLWQGIDGYREIINHCLLLRQMTRRLGWNKSDDTPTKRSIYAERLLVGLAKDPQAMLNEDCENLEDSELPELIKAILSPEIPFSSTTTEELMEIGKLARVARDGLPSAIEELTFNSLRPFSLRRLRVLRVSLVIIAKKLTDYDDGERRVAEAFWLERHQGVGPTLVSILSDVADDLNHHFALQPPPRMNQALSDLLLRIANDIITLLTRFTPTYPLISRDLRTLVVAVVDLYACANAAGSTFSQSSSAYLAAKITRRNCRVILSTLSKAIQAESGTSNAQIILRSLLSPHVEKVVRDPVHHILQVYDLTMNILPQASSDEAATFWSTEVFPKVLAELKAFSCLLDAETRATFIQRLAMLDNGEIGIGDWLLVEQMKGLLTTLHTLPSPIQEDHKLLLQYQVTSILHFCDLVISSSAWGVSSFSTNEDLSQLLNDCLTLTLDYHVTSLALKRLTRHLAEHADVFAPDVRFNILLLSLRTAQANFSVPDALKFVPDILKSLPSTSITPEHLQSEVGRLISTYSDHALEIKSDVAELTLYVLEWLASQEDVKLTTLVGLSADQFQHLCSHLASALPPERQATVSVIKDKLIIDEDEVFPSSTIEILDTLIMPLKAVENLLSPPPAEPPSTPKRGTKTPDILGVVISPPSAILRSPAATGLTKTYLNNDFRQLRQLPSTRMNTSRLPSTHVDVGINGRWT